MSAQSSIESLVTKEKDKEIERLNAVTNLQLETITDLEDRLEKAQAELDRTKKYADENLHKLITCGVAASHPDASLSRREKDYGGKWNSPQAEQVRALRDRCEKAESLQSSKSQVSDAAREKALNALLWFYPRAKPTYGRLPFAEEAIAALQSIPAEKGGE